MYVGMVQRVLMILLLYCSGLVFCTPLLAEQERASGGRLYLVSVGVGDPDNITVRAKRIIEAAEIVFTMHPERMEAELAEILRGKQVYDAGHGLFGRHARRGSEENNKILEEQARQVIRTAAAAGKTVVILASGDPTIYSPHTGFLREFEDIAPVVIPGVSSFNAANAALRRGVTEGGVSRSVILTSAAGAREGYKGSDTLAKLAETRSTMVFFTMGLKLPEIVEQLKTSYQGDTPIAIVLHAGYEAREQVIQGTLDSIVAMVGGDRLPFEHLIYVGDFLK
jgi:precorrin-4 methylase